MKRENAIISALLAMAFALIGAGCAVKHEKHSLAEVAAVAATCTTDGNIHYYKCSDCDKIFSDEDGTNEITTSVIVKAKGHKLSYMDGVAANCETAGYSPRYVCEYCDLSFSDEKGEHELTDAKIPPLGHLLRKLAVAEADCVTMSNGHIEYYVCARHCSKNFVQTESTDPNAKAMETENGETIFVAEKRAEELIVFAEHDYRGNVCRHCKHVQNTASDGLLYELSEDETYYVVSGVGTCTDTTIFISGEYHGKPVKEVKAEAFKDAAEVKAVVFIAGAVSGAYVEKIGNGAFENCSSLKNVYLPGGSDDKAELYGIQEIGENAFGGCTELTITYEGSRQEWARVKISADITVVNVVFKSVEIVVPFSL